MGLTVQGWLRKLAAGLERTLDLALTTASARFVGEADAAWLCKYSLDALAKGQLKSADRFARWAVAAAPDSALSYKTLGYVHMRAGRLAQARAALEKALLLSPSDERALQQLSDIYYAQGDYAQSEDVIRRALELPPKNRRNLMMLGTVLLKQKRLEDALSAYKDAASMWPDDPSILGAIGETYARMERFSEAISVLYEAQALDPDIAGARFYLAVSLANLGDVESARQHARCALELEPYSQEFREVLRAIENRLAD